MRGPVQAVGSGQGVNQGGQPIYPGMSGVGSGGLDDDDDLFNRHYNKLRDNHRLKHNNKEKDN